MICSYCGKEYNTSVEDRKLMGNNILLQLYCSRKCYNQKGSAALKHVRHIHRAIKSSSKLQNIY